MKKTEVRTFPIRYYLEKTKHRKEIVRMMMDLYKGKSHTMEQWESIDKQINTRRC